LYNKVKNKSCLFVWQYKNVRENGMDNPEKPGIIGYTRKRIKTNKTKNADLKRREKQHLIIYF
jgi:hypothetical protein